MYVACFRVESFALLPVQAQCALISTLVCGLAGIDEGFLRMKGQSTPRLYQSGVRYMNPKTNGDSSQNWRDVPQILRAREGTCHELCAWRMSELKLFEGIESSPYVTSKFLPTRTGPALVFHVQVLHDSGYLEDPSAALGMGSDPWNVNL